MPPIGIPRHRPFPPCVTTGSKQNPYSVPIRHTGSHARSKSDPCNTRTHTNTGSHGHTNTRTDCHQHTYTYACGPQSNESNSARRDSCNQRRLGITIVAADARAILSQRRAHLDDVKTISAYAKDIKDFLQESELTERRSFIESFVKEIIVIPGDALIRYTIPMPV